MGKVLQEQLQITASKTVHNLIPTAGLGCREVEKDLPSSVTAFGASASLILTQLMLLMSGCKGTEENLHAVTAQGLNLSE